MCRQFFWLSSGEKHTNVKVLLKSSGIQKISYCNTDLKGKGMLLNYVAWSKEMTKQTYRSIAAIIYFGNLKK
jgi:hypothetical protein